MNVERLKNGLKKINGRFLVDQIKVFSIFGKEYLVVVDDNYVPYYFDSILVEYVRDATDGVFIPKYKAIKIAEHTYIRSENSYKIEYCPYCGTWINIENNPEGVCDECLFALKAKYGYWI